MTEQNTPYTVADETSAAPVKITNVLAIALYLLGQITEGMLARKLGVDRLEARLKVAEFLDTAIDNASVPIARITTLEARVATLTAQAAGTQLELADAIERLAGRDADNHDLRNQMTARMLEIGELKDEVGRYGQDLAAERRHVIALTAVAEYAHRFTAEIIAHVGDPAQGGLSTGELHFESLSTLHRLASEALGRESEG
jgi:hypothetical protein